MASIRGIKNEIDYLVSEVISDGYMALYFNVEKRDAIVSVIEEAVAMRNNLYEKVNNPADKQNKSLVRKHSTGSIPVAGIKQASPKEVLKCV